MPWEPLHIWIRVVEEYVCRRVGLKPPSVSSQIIPREQHAHFMMVLALIAGTLDKFATEIASATDRGTGSGGAFYRRPERVLGHAA